MYRFMNRVKMFRYVVDVRGYAGRNVFRQKSTLEFIPRRLYCTQIPFSWKRNNAETFVDPLTTSEICISSTNKYGPDNV